ncbi:MAG: hypothetical protein J6Y85_04390 [Alphaproteobacteria bacterium]|nr:hypothetical protein [Alphaproteobacteria bacterium]
MNKFFIILMSVMLCTSHSAWADKARADMTRAHREKVGVTAGNPKVLDSNDTNNGSQGHIRGAAAKQRREGKAPGIFDPVSQKPTDLTDTDIFSQPLMVSRDAERKARLEQQKKLVAEIHQAIDDIPAKMNCSGANCYNVYDNPTSDTATSIAPAGLSQEIDMR